MRFVPVKTIEQQSVLMGHRARSLLVAQRTALINALRGHLAEFGIVAPQGMKGAARIMAMLAEGTEDEVPPVARAALLPLVRQIERLDGQVRVRDRQILELHRASETSRRLAAIPEVGPLTASAMAASLTEPSQFRSGREFAAFLGLVPRQSSAGGKERLGRISKMGDRYLRTLLIVGATAVLRHARKEGSALKGWTRALLERKPFKLVAVALANKLARIAWAVMARGEPFCAIRVQAA